MQFIFNINMQQKQMIADFVITSRRMPSTGGLYNILG